MRRAGQRRLLRLKQRRDEKWRALQLHRPCFAVFVPPADGDLSVVQHRLETRIQTKVAVVILDNVGLAVDRAEPGARFQPDVPSRAGKRAGQPRHQRHRRVDRKSTRLNSSHSQISYAVFCLKKKKRTIATASAEAEYSDRPSQQLRRRAFASQGPAGAGISDYLLEVGADVSARPHSRTSCNV